MKELLLSCQKSIENGQPTLYSNHIYCTFKDHAMIIIALLFFCRHHAMSQGHLLS